MEAKSDAEQQAEMYMAVDVHTTGTNWLTLIRDYFPAVLWEAEDNKVQIAVARCKVAFTRSTVAALHELCNPYLNEKCLSRDALIGYIEYHEKLKLLCPGV